MSYQGTASNNNEISEEGDTSNNKEITEEGAVASSSTTIGSNINFEATINNNNDDIEEDMYSTSDNNHISEDHVTLFVAYDGEWEYDGKEWFFKNSESSIVVVPKRITLSEISDILYKQFKVNKELYHFKLEVHYRTGSPWFPVTKIQNNKDLSVFISETSKTRLPLCVTRLKKDETDVGEESRKDYVTVCVAYNGEWDHYGKEGFFENSKSSTIFVPKHITLLEIKDILHEHLDVDKKLYYLVLGAVDGPTSEGFSAFWYDGQLSKLISETSKTKLPLCVKRALDRDAYKEVAGERRKDYVTVFVAYNGKWEYDGKEQFYKDSRGSQLVVSEHIKLSEITDILNEVFHVDKKLDRLILEVHYRTGSPWYPVTRIYNDLDLSVFISETSKTKVPLCVTRLTVGIQVAEDRQKDNTVEKRLMKAIRKGDWVKAREIVDTEEVTWTSELYGGNTAFYFAVGEFKDNEVVRDIVNALQSNRELLETTVDIQGVIPVHNAAVFGNTEALKIILDYNPKCLFICDRYSINLAINCALEIPEIETFQYLFKQMQSFKDEFDTFLRGEYGLKLLHQVIDTGLIDVAYKLIKDYPTMATQVYDDITPLERIIRKPDLFYSGAHYNMYQRFVYRHIPIENNSLGSTDHTVDVENQETPRKDKFVTKHTRRCFYNVIWMIWVKLWETIFLLVPHVKHLKEDKVQHNTTIKLLTLVCKEIEKTNTSSDVERLYSSPFCLAVENDTDEAIDVLTTYFQGLDASEKDEQNVYQLTVLNRSEKVYRYSLHHDRNAKTLFLISKDDDGNNILHLAGRLAPMHKLNAASGAALQMQRELQWFEEVKRVVGIAHTRELNDNKETPMMVFRKEHKELRKEGEEWMKKTADSYTITAALIITIVFAAAITVPGGNDSTTGKPIYETKSSLIIFAISDAISLFTSTTSLLLFLSILTARYADEDFLYKLPKRLIYGLVMLFVSVTSMMIAFSATLYIMFGQGKAWILIPIGALACLPIASFVTLQFPLLQELISSTYGHGMFGKEKDYRQSSANANKKKRV